jgi:hypothetical protein
MKIIKIILKVLGILVLLYLISAFFAKSSYKVERTGTVHAAQILVFNNLSFLHNWEAWSPWMERDPKTKLSYEGYDGTAGSKMKWVGDKQKTGSGQIEITMANPPSTIDYKLTFNGPPKSNSIGSFRLSELNPDKTQVVWTTSGDIPFVFRPMMMFMDMDKMMGTDFERGLFRLDSVCIKQYKDAVNQTFY